MRTDKNIQEARDRDISNHIGRSIVSAKRSTLLGFISFLILAFLIGAIIYQRYINKKQDKKEEALTVANNARVHLQESLAFSLSAAKTLSFFVQNDGTVKNFDSIASQILKATNDIDALQLVPGGVIKYMYPLKGNEKALGYNILKDPARNKEAVKAIEKREMFFAGPFELRQGGMGVVGRLPVFRKDKFWGFSAVVIKMPTLLRSAGIDSTGNSGYYFQLSKINPDTKKEEFFIPHKVNFSGSQNVSVNVPNGEWKLSVSPVKPYEGYENIIILAVLGILLSGLGGFLIYNISGRPKELDDLVKVRTRQLKESEENYKAVFERSPLPLWIYDLETFRFLEVNDAAVSLYGYSREEFLQMDVLSIRRAEEVQKFLETTKDNTDELRHSGAWTHLKKNNEEIQVLIFSRNIFYDGRKARLVLLMDVSEKIKIENELIKSEEKYRSLIEQASDGIILYSFDGTIHSFNKAAYNQTGYSKEEFEKLNLKDLFFEEGVSRNRSMENKINPDQSTTIYRKLKRKDGSILLVELNARMLQDGKIIAIVRDITERRKNEDILKYQARLLESVSDAITSLDLDRRIVSWNNACEDLYGFTKEDVMGKRIPQLVTFEFPNSTSEEVFKQVFTDGQWKGEFNFIHPKTNAKTHLLSNINLFKNNEGQVIGFILTSKDITDRKKAEEEINKSNERFELIAQATNEAVWDHDIIKDETWGNKKLYDLYGFEPGVGKINLEMFFERIHPDERDAIAKRMNSATEQCITSLTEVFRFKTADGEYRNFYDRAYIKYDGNGKPLRVLGAMQDITDGEIIKEQIIKEKELSDSIINSLPGVFYLFTKEGKYLRWNKNLETVTGYTGEEISLMHPLDMFDKEEKELIGAKISNVFVAGEDQVEAEFLTKNKQKIPYYFTGQAIEYEGKLCLMGVGIDFSEKEKAARIIKESEEKYRTIIEQAADGIFIADKDANIIDVNGAGCRMLGYAKEELVKMKYTSLIPAEDIVDNPVLISNLNSTRTVINERRLIRKDGSLIEVEISAKMLFDGRYQSIIRDITERKKTDKALRESEERYRALVENATEALVVFDAEKLKFVSVSESAMRLFRMSKDELLKLGPAEVSPEFQPDGRSSSEAAIEKIQKAVEGEKLSFEWTHRDKEGNLIPCEVWLVRLPSENKVLIRGSIIDITERKKIAEKLYQSEQKYRLLFYNNPLPMWMVSIPDLKIIDINESAIKQYGYTREEFLKLTTKELRPAEDVEDFLKEVDIMVPGAINIRAWRHKKKNGTVIQVETYSHQIMYEGKMVWLGLSHDVTESYKAKELLQKSYEDIRQLASNLQSIREDERTSIAREIHDELGQQLTGLKMDMHWLTRRIKDSDEEIKNKMLASLELINATIITVRKIATDLRPSILDDLGLLAALEWQSDEFEKRSGIKVKFINNAGEITVLPEVATGLFRIYQELLTNIARHANASLVTALLKIDDHSLCFSITDNGDGFNIDSINKKKTLGLLGIKERTLIMGGTSEIKSKPGEGTFVLISVPLYNDIINPNN